MERRWPLLDWTIPSELLAEPFLRSRARLVQAIYLLGTVAFAAASLARYSATGLWLTSHQIAIGAFLIGLTSLRLTRSIRFTSGLALGIGWGGVVANALQVGGLIFVLSWGSVLVAAAVYLLGLRAAIWVALLTSVAALTMSLAHHQHWLEPLSMQAVSLYADSGIQAAVMVIVQVLAMLVFMGLYFREHEVLTANLERARADAEASNRAKSVFLATMSHEIRTPMNGVLAAADLLRRSPLPEEEKSLANIVYGSGDALLGLLNDILDFSKIEAGKVALEKLPFSIREIASAAVELQQPRARQKGLLLELEVHEAVPACSSGDATRLRQVLLNLLGNAVKFTSTGRVRLSIRPGKTGVYFAVEDTGPGLTELERSRLFQPFVQADASVHRTHGGTGLGLAISRHLVEAMGGKIEVDSEPGFGSTFHFELPLPEGGELPKDTSLEPSGDLPPLIGPVLVVDDNEVNRKVAENMLRRLGCDTLSAVDGAAALERVQAESVSLVLMDRQMPVMDGLEATRRIRQLPGPLGAIPIVGLTASAFSDEINTCLEAGMQDVVSKPVSVRTLSRTLRRWALRSPGAPGAPGPQKQIDQPPT
ncbi:MAG: response regulator [Deltaproteobacteria bacterium]|nr:response regulator [Deltaproteobacteria bacterium]